MQQNISLRLLPADAADDNSVKNHIAQSLSVKPEFIFGFYRLKQSIDARSRQQVWINLTVKVFINEPFFKRECAELILPNVSNAKYAVLIIGAGPAGLFAALKLIEQGIKPIILERGKDVRARRRDLAILNKEGIVNPDCPRISTALIHNDGDDVGGESIRRAKRQGKGIGAGNRT